jgi:hypothetical protein
MRRQQAKRDEPRNRVFNQDAFLQSIGMRPIVSATEAAARDVQEVMDKHRENLKRTLSKLTENA